MGHENGGWMNSDQQEAVRDDWDGYEAKPPEDRLRVLANHYTRAFKDGDYGKQRFFEGRIIELTIDMVDHPGWLDEGCPCCCQECCSNA